MNFKAEGQKTGEKNVQPKKKGHPKRKRPSYQGGTSQKNVRKRENHLRHLSSNSKEKKEKQGADDQTGKIYMQGGERGGKKISSSQKKDNYILQEFLREKSSSP